LFAVIEEDDCGCPNKTECLCNPELCPKEPECPKCTTIFKEEPSTESKSCEGCCPTYRCVRQNCSRSHFNKEGYIPNPNSDDCCPEWICDSCVLHDRTIKQVSKEGKASYPTSSLLFEKPKT